ncbi:ABC transporter ATP-binding protein [Acidithrix ferrooxidans]|nr:sn-glycerol-3-phosphate ABC transporter ATP-binding protein UgpC [Acidithrix ferrooxidans]
MTSIMLESLTKSYGKAGTAVVDGINLEIENGEFVVLLGPSGCGKTTTLRMIAGLEKITSGSIKFGDKVMNDIPGDRRNVGMVFQNYALYPHMSVFENLAFGLRSRGTTKVEAAIRVDEVLEMLELSAMKRRKPRELSGGQRQRVALGRALVGRPSVFLMDEPLSNLDANLREQMRIEIGKLHHSLGITTIYVTHDQGEALTLADRIVVMHNGTIKQVAKPREIYNSPADSFVAKFIGSPGMNLTEVELRTDGDRIRGGEAISLPREAARVVGSHLNKKVLLGIRPELLSLVGDENDAKIVGEIQLVEQMGSQLQTYFKIEGPSSSQNFIAKLPPDSTPRIGEKIALFARPSDLRFFDALSGNALDRLLDIDEVKAESLVG